MVDKGLFVKYVIYCLAASRNQVSCPKMNIEGAFADLFQASIEDIRVEDIRVVI